MGQMRLKNRVEGIPGDFHYFSPITEIHIGPHHNIDDLVRGVHEHDKANEIDLTTEDEIEAQVCLRSPDYCMEHDEDFYPVNLDDVFFDRPKKVDSVEPPSPKWSKDIPKKLPPITLKAVRMATKKLALWTISGRPKVTPEHSAQRAAVCLQCPYHAKVEGCKGCRADAVLNVVNFVVGPSSFAGADQLGACKACGCALRAKVQLPIDYLRSLDEQLPEHCWINKE